MKWWGSARALREEPALDRSERYLTLDRALLGTGGAGGMGGICGRGLAGERGHGLVLEKLPHGEGQAGLARPGHDLDGEDRIAAELEEVVVHPYPWQAQDLRPDRRQKLLLASARRHIACSRAGLLRSWQDLPVHLAVGRQGQRREGDEGGGHHRFRQPLPQSLAQLAGRSITHHIGDETLLGSILAQSILARKTTASRTPGSERSAASISPSSMRTPRILT